MKIRILAIVPYIGMKKIVEDAASKYPDIDLTTRIGTREGALEIVRSYDINTFDIILARGGTTKIIASHVNIPVVEIKISVYDILRAIKLAENYNNHFAIIGIPAITESARLLCNLIQNDIKIVTLEKYADSKNALQGLLNEGYEMAICDMATTQIAYEVGMNYILIASGTESIDAALKQSIEQARLFQFYRQREKQFMAAFSGDPDSLFIYDRNGTLIFNSIIRSAENELAFKFINQNLSFFLSNNSYFLEERTDNLILTFRSKHITIDETDFIYIFLCKQNAPALIDDLGVSIYERIDHANMDDAFYGSANLIGHTRKLLEQYSQTLHPLLILGEPGTGKDKAATFICGHSEYKKHPFYMIDCENTNQKKWNYFMESPNSPLNDIHITIYIKNFQALNEAISNKFLAYLKQNDLCKRNHFIFSYSLSRETDIDSTVYQHITNYLSCLVLRLSPLRDRKEDIANIATIYINQTNMELGKEVVGFEDGAMDLMKNFSWPNNLTQFKRIIRELIVLTDKDYISTDQVKQLLKQEEPIFTDTLQDGYEIINTNQSLADINYDIVRLVLKQENMNRTNVVKRLQISRSTLWRMLQ